MNTVRGECVANGIRLVRVVDGDVGSVLQFRNNRILDENAPPPSTDSDPCSAPRVRQGPGPSPSLLAKEIWESSQ